MTTSKRSVRTYLQTVLVLLAASSTGVVAQEPAYESPVIEFDPQGISLVEAVRLTLEYEPFIKLQDAAVDFQAGLAQEQTGFFDFTLLGNLFTEYRVQELTESRKEIERDKRDQLQQAVDRNREDANQAETLIARIQDVRDAPPGSERVALLKEADPEIGTQVEVIDVLIAAQDDPVVREELLRVRQELLARSSPMFRGASSSSSMASRTPNRRSSIWVRFPRTRCSTTPIWTFSCPSSFAPGSR